MTCIVGFVDKENNTVIIGGDSAASNVNSVEARKEVKVFENGDFIFGCTTSFRMLQLLQFSFKAPEIGDKDLYEYMCTDFINAVRECFKEGGFLQSPNGEEVGGTFLVATKDRLFKIEEDFQVAETLIGIDAVGCGADFALGALYTIQTDEKLTSEEKVLKSLEASDFFVMGVCKPFITIKTK